jgi:hypothetical protein
MIAAAPEGTPPRRIGEQNSKQLPAPPCLAEALRRESIVWRRFSWSGCELPFMSVSTERAMSLWLIDEYEKRVLRNPLFQIPETIDQL